VKWSIAFESGPNYWPFRFHVSCLPCCLTSKVVNGTVSFTTFPKFPFIGHDDLPKPILITCAVDKVLLNSLKEAITRQICKFFDPVFHYDAAE
jgi:hypothetical protein